MSDLREQFEKETQNQAIYRKFGIDYHTLKYVKWLESQLTELKAENEAWQAKCNRQKQDLLRVRAENASLKSKMDKAQTCVMYDVDAGHLSFERDSRHNREVEVLLIEVEEKE